MCCSSNPAKESQVHGQVSVLGSVPCSGRKLAGFAAHIKMPCLRDCRPKEAAKPPDKSRAALELPCLRTKPRVIRRSRSSISHIALGHCAFVIVNGAPPSSLMDFYCSSGRLATKP